MNKKNLIKELVIIAVLISLELVLALTPLGYLPIGPLVISFMMLPVAVAAISTGVKGGAITGTVFGITSFATCFGKDLFGTTLCGINPFLTGVMCIGTRLLAGVLAALVFCGLKKIINRYVAYYITGFCASLFNTILFTSSLILFFANTEYLQGFIAGKNLFIFACTFVGVNAVFEIIAATLLTGLIGTALNKANLIER